MGKLFLFLAVGGLGWCGNGDEGSGGGIPAEARVFALNLLDELGITGLQLLLLLLEQLEFELEILKLEALQAGDLRKRFGGRNAGG
jgi:hypothetical protein